MEEQTKEHLILALLAAAGTFVITFLALQYKPTVEQKIREFIK